MVSIVVFGIGGVEHDGHVVIFLLLVVSLQFGQHGTLQQTCTYDEERDVGLSADDGGIGHNLHRGAVDEDEVVFLAQLVEHGLQLGRIEQLGWVRGRFTHWQEVDGLSSLALLGSFAVLLFSHSQRLAYDKFVVVVGLSAQIVSEPLLWRADEL